MQNRAYLVYIVYTEANEVLRPSQAAIVAIIRREFRKYPASALRPIPPVAIAR